MRLLELTVSLGLLGLACGGPAAVALEAPQPQDPDAFRYEVPAPGPLPRLPDVVPTTLTLPNGFAIWSLPWDSGTVALELRCRAGSRFDPEGRSGLASLTARLLTEGTREATALEQAVAFENLGATLEHDVGSDSLALSSQALPEQLEPVLALLSQGLREPAFRSADVERVRMERLDALKAERQDPGRLAWLLAQRAVLGPRLGRSSAGSPKDVGQLQVSDIERFHRERIAPERCALLLAGSFDEHALGDGAIRIFGDWAPLASTRTEARDEPVPAPDAPEPKVVFVERAAAVQSALVVARPLPGRLDPSHEARQVVSNLFGGLFTSRLNTNIRERNAFSYGAFAYVVATRDIGGWFIASDVRTDVTLPALREIRAELARLGGAPPDEREIQSATTDLIQRQRARFEHDTRLVSNLAEAFAYELPAAHFVGHAERLAALEVQTLRETAATLGGGSFVTVVVAAGEVRQTLQRAGLVVVDPPPEWLE